MIHFTAYKAEHFSTFELQPKQRWFIPSFDALRSLEDGYAATILRDGVPIACWGAQKLWENRGLIWTFLSTRVDRHCFRELHAMAKMHLGLLPYRRIEAIVEHDHEAGHRWVKSLGFTVEAPRLRAFHFDGRDCALYARVRED